jgi:hypothetical protein
MHLSNGDWETYLQSHGIEQWTVDAEAKVRVKTTDPSNKRVKIDIERVAVIDRITVDLGGKSQSFTGGGVILREVEG